MLFSFAEWKGKRKENWNIEMEGKRKRSGVLKWKETEGWNSETERKRKIEY